MSQKGPERARLTRRRICNRGFTLGEVIAKPPLYIRKHVSSSGEFSVSFITAHGRARWRNAVEDGRKRWRVAEDGRSQWKTMRAEESRQRLRKKADLAGRSQKGRGSEVSKP